MSKKIAAASKNQQKSIPKIANKTGKKTAEEGVTGMRK